MDTNEKSVLSLTDLSINPYGIGIGDVITAYNNGIHKVVDIIQKGKTFDVQYNQIFNQTDGRPVNMFRPAICDIKYCKPAMLLLPEYRKKIKWFMELIKFLEMEQNKQL